MSDLQNNFINFCKNYYSYFPLQLSNLERRIFVDVTYTIKQSRITGIPRVVTEIVSCAGGEVIPVFLYENNIFTLSSDLSKFEVVEIGVNDYYIFPDAAWNYPNSLDEILQKISIKGSKSIIIIYDLIPLLYPQLSNQTHVDAFENWLNVIITRASNVICISKSVMSDFITLIDESKNTANSIDSVGWFHLGSDFNGNEQDIDMELLPLELKVQQPFFLSVGTVEPRKAYSVCIDAMERLWALGIDTSFVIVGKYGWSQSHLKERILKHPEYRTRLYWFDSATDTELRYLYSNALALVSSSLSEGFGLPLIEAAHNGLSSIVSDIPVFREIGGNSTKFFEVTNGLELSFQLEVALQNSKVKPDLDFLTWRESISRMINMIVNDEYQYKKS